MAAASALAEPAVVVAAELAIAVAAALASPPFRAVAVAAHAQRQVSQYSTGSRCIDNTVLCCLLEVLYAFAWKLCHIWACAGQAALLSAKVPEALALAELVASCTGEGGDGGGGEGSEGGGGAWTTFRPE